MLNSIKKNFINILFTLFVIVLIIVFIAEFYGYNLNSSFYIIIGAGITAFTTIKWNEYVLKKSEQKDQKIEELNKIKIFSAVNNDFEFNAGAAKANIKIIEDKPKKIHLHLLKTGFRDLINLNIPFKERTEEEINSMEIIAITTEYINRQILARENLLIFVETRRDELDPEDGIIEEYNYKIYGYNKNILKNCKTLVDAIEQYDSDFLVKKLK